MSEYEKYISSGRWRSNPARVREMSNAGNRCRVCGAQGSTSSPLEAHHSTYERLGRETDGDLIAVCRECHHEITCFIRRRRYVARAVTRADVVSQRDVRTALFDPTRKETMS